jgi:nucleotide-binding universal stress UspA family protein
MLAQLLQRDYELVVVGYQARSFLEKAIWGSLAARIAHELPLSVLIVRGRRDRINRVLIGISGGGFTNECVAWGGRIAAAFGADVTLVHASPAPPLMYGGLDEVVETLTELLQTSTPEAEAIKQAVAVLNRLGVQTDVELTRGLADRELLRKAQELDVDLLVIGSSWAAQPVHRFFVRNVTEQVLLNTQRPVLVVRPIR